MLSVNSIWRLLLPFVHSLLSNMSGDSNNHSTHNLIDSTSPTTCQCKSTSYSNCSWITASNTCLGAPSPLPFHTSGRNNGNNVPIGSGKWSLLRCQLELCYYILLTLLPRKYPSWWRAHRSGSSYSPNARSVMHTCAWGHFLSPRWCTNSEHPWPTLATWSCSV